MKISTAIELIGNIYSAQIDVVALTPLEEAKMAQFGEPLVETGGDFSGTVHRVPNDEGTLVEFSMPQAPRRLKSDFPVKFISSLDDYPSDADLRVRLWADTIVLAMQVARDTVLSLSSPLVSEVVATM